MRLIAFTYDGGGRQEKFGVPPDFRLPEVENGQEWLRFDGVDGLACCVSLRGCEWITAYDEPTPVVAEVRAESGLRAASG